MRERRHSLAALLLAGLSTEMNDRPMASKATSSLDVSRHPCDRCDASFSRAEHLARHQLSHSSHRPFPCPRCNKKFTRRDTLIRHISVHNSEGRLPGVRSATRVSKACASCARLRLRCDGQDPCQRCVLKDVRCTYVPGLRPRIVPESQDLTPSSAAHTNDHSSPEGVAGEQDDLRSITVLLSTPASAEKSPAGLQDPGSARLPKSGGSTGQQRTGDRSGLETFIQASLNLETSRSEGQETPNSGQVEQQPAMPIDDTASLPRDGNETPSSMPFAGHAGLLPESSVAAGAYASRIEPPGRQDSFIPGDYMDGSATTLMTPNQDISTLLEFSVPWNHDFSVIDWISPETCAFETFDPGYTADTPSMFFSGGTPFQSSHEYADSSYPPREGNRLGGGHGLRPPSRRYNLPNNSPVGLQFRGARPADPEGHIYAVSGAAGEQRQPGLHQWPADWDPTKQDNLVAFPDMSQVTMDILNAEDLAHVGSLSPRCYAEIVQCLRHCGVDHAHFRPFKNANLPPLKAMNCFIQLYFEYFHPLFPMLHQGTFDPAREPWQLVLAVAATGCRYSKLPGSGQFANALQELLRRAIANTLEADNSTARKTWMCQCIILNFLGMAYSGNKRLLELAESGRNTPATMARRNGCLLNHGGIRHSARVQFSSRAELERAWAEWVSEETSRRLGYCAFFSDAQVAMHLDFTPCMSPAELQQSLPEHEVLWEAPDAESWATRLLQLGPAEYDTPTPSVALRIVGEQKSLPSGIGDFARLVLVFVTYQRRVAVADCIGDSLLAGSIPIVVTRDELTDRAAAVIEALRPTSGSGSSNELLRLSLECHLTLALMILYARRKDLLSIAHSFNTQTEEDPAAGRRLADWMSERAGKTARIAVGYAGILLTTIRKFSTRGFHEPIAALLAVLLLWSYNRLVTTQTSPNDQQMASGGGSGLERGSVIRLDRVKKTSDMRAWHNGQQGLRPHLHEVGNITRPGAGAGILESGRRLLQDMDVWALSHGFAGWLGKMKAHM